MSTASLIEVGRCRVCGSLLRVSCLADRICEACQSDIQLPSSEHPPIKLPPLTLLRLQEALPEFAIHNLAGKGGCARVYKATEKAEHLTVAIKAIQIDPKDHDWIERFESECEALAQLVHENIPGFYYSSQVGAIHYAVMEWLPDGSLARYLKKFEAEGKPPLRPGKVLYRWWMRFIGREPREGSNKADKPCLPLSKIMSIILDLCDALIFIHENGRIHRDVKPENMLFKGESICLVDFGFSRRLEKRRHPGLTRAGTSIGTPGYRSPEQVDGSSVDQRTDIFSVGAVLLHLFTLCDPRGSRCLPSEKGYSKAFDAIINKAMEYDPKDRFPDMVSMRKAIVQAGVGCRVRQVATYLFAAFGILIGTWAMWSHWA